MKADEENKLHDEDIEITLSSVASDNKIASPDNFSICIYRDVFDAIKEYALTDTKKELGGILLGSRLIDDADCTKETMIIKAYVPALYTEALQGSITFTHRSWDYMHAERERRYANLKIVGWFHTHPGFGIFLSSYDLFIQSNFFNLPWQTALVVDPVNKTDGFFCWDEGQVVRCEFNVIGNPAAGTTGEAVAMPSASGVQKKTGCAKKLPWIAVLFVLFAGIGGGLFYKYSMEQSYKNQITHLQQQIDAVNSTHQVMQEANEIRYIVRHGDTLAGISSSIYGTPDRVPSIAARNNIQSADIIHPGQILLLTPQ